MVMLGCHVLCPLSTGSARGVQSKSTSTALPGNASCFGITTSTSSSSWVCSKGSVASAGMRPGFSLGSAHSSPWCHEQMSKAGRLRLWCLSPESIPRAGSWHCHLPAHHLWVLGLCVWLHGQVGVLVLPPFSTPVLPKACVELPDIGT